MASQALKVCQLGSLGQMVSLVPLLVEVGIEVLKSQEGLEVRRAHGPTCEYWLRPGPGPPPWTWPCPCPVAATVLLGATAEVGELVGATAEWANPPRWWRPLPRCGWPGGARGRRDALVEDEPGGTAVVGVVMPCVADPGVIDLARLSRELASLGRRRPPRTWHEVGDVVAPGVRPGLWSTPERWS